MRYALVLISVLAVGCGGESGFATSNTSITPDCIHNLFGRFMRDGKRNPDTGACWGEDRRIDTHDLSTWIKERATGVPPVNRGICLDIVDISPRLDPIPPDRGDNPKAG